MVTFFYCSVILITSWIIEGLPITNLSRSITMPSRMYLPTKNVLDVNSGQQNNDDYYPAALISSIQEENTRPVYELMDDGNQLLLPTAIRGNGQSTGHTFVQRELKRMHHDLATDVVGSAITSLDWFLGNKSYNTPLHPPPSSLLALVLSHYGRYLPSTRSPRVYSYMTVNNIHNNRPFGQYKWACDQESNSAESD
ncbi:uncharacterized protein [Chelonus insularis]|uniref:uncharacterized protein n=1 Tax=Chelonus insularis TaxID=460826 RepID=UPI00158F07B6|nr:uncharacterized protein LOC118066040 [Chelonus insularis]